MINLEETKQNLLVHLAEITQQIEIAEMPLSFKKTQITIAQIKNENDVQEIVATLPKSGCHIYYFEVDNPERLSQIFNKERDKSIKYARLNYNEGSPYVYVGSCTKTKLSNRFKQHLGYGHRSTYALQLSKWLTDEELIFTFAYVEIQNNLVAQQLEDQLHRDLKPLFGKSGGNNKIASPK